MTISTIANVTGVVDPSAVVLGGVAVVTSLNGNTISTGTGTLNLNSKTFVTTASLTLAGTDGKIMTFPSTDATIARTDAAQTFTGAQGFASGLIVPKTTTTGIQVDTASPTWPWRDIIGAVSPKASGVGSPVRAAYAGGNVGVYAFAAGDICDFCFHMPHDWVPGTDIFFHVHWSHNGTSISGNAVFDFYYQIAKRDGNFGAEKDVTITYNTTNIGTTPQYRHRVDETQLTASVATATLAATSELEVDGIIEGTLKLTTLPTIGGAGKLFIHTCDIHYQSTNVGTKNKASNFYA